MEGKRPDLDQLLKRAQQVLGPPSKQNQAPGKGKLTKKKKKPSEIGEKKVKQKLVEELSFSSDSDVENINPSNQLSNLKRVVGPTMKEASRAQKHAKSGVFSTLGSTTKQEGLPKHGTGKKGLCQGQSADDKKQRKAENAKNCTKGNKFFDQVEFSSDSNDDDSNFIKEMASPCSQMSREKTPIGTVKNSPKISCHKVESSDHKHKNGLVTENKSKSPFLTVQEKQGKPKTVGQNFEDDCFRKPRKIHASGEPHKLHSETTSLTSTKRRHFSELITFSSESDSEDLIVPETQASQTDMSVGSLPETSVSTINTTCSSQASTDSDVISQLSLRLESLLSSTKQKKKGTKKKQKNISKEDKVQDWLSKPSGGRHHSGQAYTSTKDHVRGFKDGDACEVSANSEGLLMSSISSNNDTADCSSGSAARVISDTYSSEDRKHCKVNSSENKTAASSTNVNTGMHSLFTDFDMQSCVGQSVSDDPADADVEFKVTDPEDAKMNEYGSPVATTKTTKVETRKSFYSSVKDMSMQACFESSEEEEKDDQMDSRLFCVDDIKDMSSPVVSSSKTKIETRKSYVCTVQDMSMQACFDSADDDDDSSEKLETSGGDSNFIQSPAPSNKMVCPSSKSEDSYCVVKDISIQASLDGSDNPVLLSPCSPQGLQSPKSGTFKGKSKRRHTEYFDCIDHGFPVEVPALAGYHGTPTLSKQILTPVTPASLRKPREVKADQSYYCTVQDISVQACFDDSVVEDSNDPTDAVLDSAKRVGAGRPVSSNLSFQRFQALTETDQVDVSDNNRGDQISSPGEESFYSTAEQASKNESLCIDEEGQGETDQSDDTQPNIYKTEDDISNVESRRDIHSRKEKSGSGSSINFCNFDQGPEKSLNKRIAQNSPSGEQDHSSKNQQGKGNIGKSSDDARSRVTKGSRRRRELGHDNSGDESSLINPMENDQSGSEVPYADQSDCTRGTQVLRDDVPVAGDSRLAESAAGVSLYREPEVILLSSDSEDDHLENFFVKMKTPKADKKPPPRVNDFIVDEAEEVSDDHESDGDSMDDFIVDDDEEISGESEEDSVFYRKTSLDFATPLTKRLNCPRHLGTPRIISSDEDSDGTDSFMNTHVSVKKKQLNPGDRGSFEFKTPAARPDHYKIGGTSFKPRATTSAKKVPEQRKVAENKPYSTGGLKELSFLRSLSTNLPVGQRHPLAARFVKDFKKLKEDLTQHLFKLYNDTVFGNQLQKDMQITWNSRLTKTAGLCYFKRDRTAALGRFCRIELSVKVCDSAERTRDTLIHELCHAAVWLISGINGGHGPYWKCWAQKANISHPELPPIKRCHSYEISHKFIYKCVKCGYQLGRHSKSLDTTRKVCGYCHGTFELFRNGKSTALKTPATPKTPNKFAMFVKENYGSTKKENQSLKHKDIMRLLSSDFAAKNKISGS